MKVKICFSFVGIQSYKLYLVTIANRVINNERKRKKILIVPSILFCYYSFPFLFDFHGQNHLNVNALHTFSHSLFIMSLGFFPTKKESKTTTSSLSTNDQQHQRHRRIHPAIIGTRKKCNVSPIINWEQTDSISRRKEKFNLLILTLAF
jgi:hypothetical protein